MTCEAWCDLLFAVAENVGTIVDTPIFSTSSRKSVRKCGFFVFNQEWLFYLFRIIV